MHWLLQAGFIIAHLLAYIAVFRYWRAFTAERTIVIYHGLRRFLWSSLLLSPTAPLGSPHRAGCLQCNTSIACPSSNYGRWPRAAIRCRFFLRVSRQPSISREEIIATCKAIGADKKRNRLDDLQSLKLIEKSPDGTFELSAIPIRGFRTKCFRSPAPRSDTLRGHHPGRPVESLS
jgi:hypothetical protein